MHPLSKEEKRILLNKETEAPFSGKYLKHKESGIYICRQCGTELYKSQDKFDSGCGWPSFDDSTNAVKKIPDADGHRTEIICNSCGGHLGHVFEGESFTPKNIRHCVNSLSLAFIPEEKISEYKNTHEVKYKEAFFAGGCFWGIENAFQNIPGVVKTISGYMGGTTSDPNYEQVCTGTTGHAETVYVCFDPQKVSYIDLAKLFFEIHDPTQYNKQGPDIGTQYRSAVFYIDEEQKKIILNLIEQLTQKNKLDIVTQVVPAKEFYPAEEYHQNFISKTGHGGCCIKTPRF